MPTTDSLFLALDSVGPLMAATVGVAAILGALDSEYHYIRKVGWKVYTNDRPNPLRVGAAIAMTVLCVVGPIPAAVELGYLNLLPGDPAGYGVLIGAGLFATVLRGFAPVHVSWTPVSIPVVRAASEDPQ